MSFKISGITSLLRPQSGTGSADAGRHARPSAPDANPADAKIAARAAPSSNTLARARSRFSRILASFRQGSRAQRPSAGSEAHAPQQRLQALTNDGWEGNAHAGPPPARTTHIPTAQSGLSSLQRDGWDDAHVPSTAQDDRRNQIAALQDDGWGDAHSPSRPVTARQEEPSARPDAPPPAYTSLYPDYRPYPNENRTAPAGQRAQDDPWAPVDIAPPYRR